MNTDRVNKYKYGDIHTWNEIKEWKEWYICTGSWSQSMETLIGFLLFPLYSLSQSLSSIKADSGIGSDCSQKCLSFLFSNSRSRKERGSPGGERRKNKQRHCLESVLGAKLTHLCAAPAVVETFPASPRMKEETRVREERKRVRSLSVRVP